MARSVDDEIRRLQEDVARRQSRARGPQAIRETLSALLARRGYASLEVATDRERAWQQVVGDPLAAYTRLGHVRRGILEVMVGNSAVLQQLTLQKQQLLQGLTVALPDQRIRDLRFRIGAVT
jgi:predicted nucleic acid-binding Zn ribbon protein